LLEQARARNHEAWERIVRLYSPLVYNWCRRSGLREDDILDVAQEVFRSVYAKLDGFQKVRPDQSFRAWLKTITRHKVTDFHRLMSRQPAGQGGSEAQEMLENWADVVPASEADPAEDEDEKADESERKLILGRCLDMVRDEFEPRTWNAFWNVVVDEIPAAEVAGSLGISRNAVYLAKSRVLKRLSERFDQLVEDLTELR
jgi:RNA polymerase sigma-70 factor (ECF subfamily)